MGIKLRPTSITDIDFVFLSEQENENKQFVEPWTKEQHIKSLDDQDIRHLLIESTEEQRLLGYIILAGITIPGKSIEFKRIVVNEKGKGYGREAIRLIKELVFEEYNAHRLWLDVKENNYRAQNLYKSEGFVFEGKLRECIKTDKGFESLIIMSILESEYRNKH